MDKNPSQDLVKLIEMQWKKIEDISNTINQAQNADDEVVIDLYNERGLIYFFLGKYELAINDFNYVLNVLYANQKVPSRVFGTALWGRLLSHAYNNCEKETFEDIYLIRCYFIHDITPCYLKTGVSTSQMKNNCLLIPVAQFSNPNERISPGECKERVRGTANIMRIIALKIPNTSLAAAVEYTISELESAAYKCCDRNHWTDCLSPIIDSWHYLKNCMDKGVAIAPKLLIGK